MDQIEQFYLECVKTKTLRTCASTDIVMFTYENEHWILKSETQRCIYECSCTCAFKEKPGKKKKFIDKKNAVTFHLVHRSQRDPLQASEEASKHVLQPLDSQSDAKKKRIEEQQKFGVFFDDDYDYLQHLKETDEAYELEPVDKSPQSANKSKVPGIQLPSSVFPSEVETDIGLLNKAVPLRGPQPDWDPDIVAALDDDFDYKNPANELEDDFIVMANAEGDGDNEEEMGSDIEYGSDECEFSDEEYDRFGDDGMFGNEETKSRFTEYSMSSSVIRRNDGLSLLDDRFEKLYEQYDDSEIGALDQDDIDGSVQQGSHMLDSILEDFEKQQGDRRGLKDVVDENSEPEDVDVESEDSSTEADLVKMVIEEPKEKWDCESILSTYSNLYNHPKLIEEPKKEKIRLTTKIGIPHGVLDKPGITQKQLEEEMRASRKADMASTYRPKDETAEEKKLRKKAIKEERKDRRVEKKSNKKAFSEEKKRVGKEMMNVHNKLKGIKIS
ncbi:hypothetical protein FSP39_002023 [Pinctada imbricata]|uniref:Protein LTV1 homolog n=1 Tax=Pinctada imbricata TaxID=66713 RepID=A0AA88XNG8_PINIB|nr:hypothetical protein FSP39_002023 [Pinctada imbricata]